VFHILIPQGLRDTASINVQILQKTINNDENELFSQKKQIRDVKQKGLKDETNILTVVINNRELMILK
jgi:hypothetical protein